MKRKDYLNVDQQIDYLSFKGLSFSHPISAKKILQEYSYYALTACKDLFYIPGTRNYINGVDFEDLYRMYIYDKDIKTLFLKELLLIEQKIKTSIGKVLSEKYGINEKVYLDRKNFDLTNPFTDLVLSKVWKQLNDYGANNRSVSHYQNKYGYLPFWIMSKCLTIGVIRDLFFVMKSDDQNIVASIVLNKYIHKKPVRLLKSLIALVADMRNMCAHDEMLVHFRHKRLMIPPLPEHAYLAIEKSSSGEYLRGRNGILALLISIGYFENKQSYNAFLKSFTKMTTKNYSNLKHLITWEKYLSYIGLCDRFDKLAIMNDER